MNVSSYYAGTGGGAGPAQVFPTVATSDGRLYASPTAAAGVREVDPSTGYSASTHGFDPGLHGYQRQLHHQGQGQGLGGYASSYPGFNYAPCGGGGQSAYPPPRYLHDADKFEAGNDVIIGQYGGSRHFNTAAMMAAAAVQAASIGGGHHGVGPATCPTLPIYPWMRSIGTGMINTLSLLYSVSNKQGWNCRGLRG